MPDFKPQCPECLYPMLKLSDYDGDCSLDAPGFNSSDARDFPFGFHELAFIFDILRDVGSGLRNLARRRKVKKLRLEILPQWPQTLVCPHCLHLRKERQEER